MGEAGHIRDAVERAINEVFAQQVPALCEEVVRRVQVALAAASTPGQDNSAQLNAALAAIQQSVNQAEILSALLDGMAGFSGRAALFVIRGAAAQGWQARGLMQNEAIRAIGLDTAAGLAGRAVQTRLPAAGIAAEFEPRFRGAFGEPVGAGVIVLPLVVRDKVAALVYADTGTEPEGRLDPAAVELLVRSASIWIELAAGRKTGIAVAEPAPRAAAVAASAAAAATSEAAPATAEAPPPPVAPETSSATIPAPMPEPQSEPAPALSPQAAEVHRKAKRFAKLLVEEIKLYNPVKVAEGRQKMNLYDLLRDDIQKSRASYDKRYGESAAASADYFTQELIRILAEGDASLLGGSFSR